MLWRVFWSRYTPARCDFGVQKWCCGGSPGADTHRQGFGRFFKHPSWTPRIAPCPDDSVPERVLKHPSWTPEIAPRLDDLAPQRVSKHLSWTPEIAPCLGEMTAPGWLPPNHEPGSRSPPCVFDRALYLKRPGRAFSSWLSSSSSSSSSPPPPPRPGGASRGRTGRENHTFRTRKPHSRSHRHHAREVPVGAGRLEKTTLLERRKKVHAADRLARSRSRSHRHHVREVPVGVGRV